MGARTQRADLKGRIIATMAGGLTTAGSIARREGVSERTIYRYIARLKAAGEPIRGEKGVGYMLRRRGQV